MANVGTRIRDTRAARGLTQTQLAKAAGCGQSLIGNLESGAQKSTALLPQIARALGVSASWLADGVGQRDEPLSAMEPAAPYEVSPPSSEVQELFDRLTPSQQKAQIQAMRTLVEANDRLFEELSKARKPLPENRPGFRLGGAIVDSATPSQKKRPKSA